MIQAACGEALISGRGHVGWTGGTTSDGRLLQGLLERLDEGVVIGDGGFVFALEKRGYVKAGPWTPEATMQYPEAGEDASDCLWNSVMDVEDLDTKL